MHPRLLLLLFTQSLEGSAKEGVLPSPCHHGQHFLLIVPFSPHLSIRQASRLDSAQGLQSKQQAHLDNSWFSKVSSIPCLQRLAQDSWSVSQLVRLRDHAPALLRRQQAEATSSSRVVMPRATPGVFAWMQETKQNTNPTDKMKWGDWIAQNVVTKHQIETAEHSHWRRVGCSPQCHAKRRDWTEHNPVPQCYVSLSRCYAAAPNPTTAMLQHHIWH